MSLSGSAKDPSDPPHLGRPWLRLALVLVAPVLFLLGCIHLIR